MEKHEFCAWHWLVIIRYKETDSREGPSILPAEGKRKCEDNEKSREGKKIRSSRRNIWGSLVVRCRNYPSPFSPFSLLITLFVLAGFDHFGGVSLACLTNFSCSSCFPFSLSPFLFSLFLIYSLLTRMLFKSHRILIMFPLKLQEDKLLINTIIKIKVVFFNQSNEYWMKRSINND